MPNAIKNRGGRIGPWTLANSKPPERKTKHVIICGHYLPNTLLMIDRLVPEPLLIEVRTVAAL